MQENLFVCRETLSSIVIIYGHQFFHFNLSNAIVLVALSIVHNVYSSKGLLNEILKKLEKEKKGSYTKNEIDEILGLIKTDL